MSRFATALICTATVGFLVLSQTAMAQPEHHDQGHMLYHDTYQHWMQPDQPTVSCCRARIVFPGGGMTGDCRPTPFRLVGTGDKTHWQAKLDDGSWIDIPPNKLIHEKNPDPSGVTGHLCENYGVVYCARPPTGAM